MNNTNAEKEFASFVEEYEREIVPLTKQLNLAEFNASVTGENSYYLLAEKFSLQFENYHSDKVKFKYLKELLEREVLQKPELKRIAQILFNTFARRQYDKELMESIVRLSAKLEKKYATFRANVDGASVTDNEIDAVLAESNDSEKVKKYWEASKEVGLEIKDDALELVNLRNTAARELGYANFFEMSLKLNELEPAFIERLFNNLDKKTLPAFQKIKYRIDNKLAEKFNIKESELMPWHYGDRFFQNPPQVFSVDLDSFYKSANLEKLTAEYYASLGLPIDDILEKSDLYERENKYQHAYCTNIDRAGDVRVVCNIKPNFQWASTMLHEFGHAAYDKFISRSLPWLVREPAHIFTTEAIAMMFERMAQNPEFIKRAKGELPEELKNRGGTVRELLKTKLLVFVRWALVVFNFERELYANPDGRLNDLWHELANKYQRLPRLEREVKADWAAKIHIALYPAYYQNYVLGELLASQLYNVLAELTGRKVSEAPCFWGRREAGDFLREKFFAPGALYHWADLIKRSTNEEFTPKYFLNEFA